MTLEALGGSGVAAILLAVALDVAILAFTCAVQVGTWATRAADRAIRRHLEASRGLETWTAGLPAGARVEQILFDGYHVNTGPMPASLFRAGGCGAGLLCRHETRIALHISYPGGQRIIAATKVSP